MYNVINWLVVLYVHDVAYGPAHDELLDLKVGGRVPQHVAHR